jgi:hypothetical protein
MLQVQAASGCFSLDTVVVVVSQAGQGVVLQGQLIYDNPGQTPMREGMITLEGISTPMHAAKGVAKSSFKRQSKRKSGGNSTLISPQTTEQQ